uniref:Uncharacterized protein n=1 Tax=Anguilla anguilla TaxID=7936 RepID=A0A0E9W5D4_ANGAN
MVESSHSETAAAAPYEVIIGRTFVVMYGCIIFWAINVKMETKDKVGSKICKSGLNHHSIASNS